MSETEKAYLAGIIDGEGSILVSRVSRPANRSGYRFYPVVQIINTSKQMLEWVSTVTGIGKIYNKKHAGEGAKRKAYTWKTKHQQVRRVLEQILPYLIIKKDSAENCIEFCKFLEETGKANYSKYPLEKLEYFWNRSSDLNKRGELIDKDNPVRSSKSMKRVEMRDPIIYRKNNWHMKTSSVVINKARRKILIDQQNLEEVYSQTPVALGSSSSGS
jgi:hypothetical protein